MRYRQKRMKYESRILRGLDFFKHKGLMDVINAKGSEVELFSMFENFPLSRALPIIAIFLISTFFITSADSATFVLGMQTINGDLNPSNKIKLVRGLIQSGTAAILLWTGGMKALQRASIKAAFPFTIVMILIVFSLIKSLRKDRFVTGK
ncbi:BCCT family transporter [Neobacillus sp. PS3-34]|uniref:BCCT family transporter n=1 Tax=Neobacillus sp. PS3-34 TaxID=3070678 RepID=UPI0027DF5727|nr:BCCT family transporter [Neobacillus sp. PS3-34]WML50121.1 BCCT family transporter [Neobacillus sp. PS3-34]